jgi:hypothetical protein
MGGGCGGITRTRAGKSARRGDSCPSTRRYFPPPPPPPPPVGVLVAVGTAVRVGVGVGVGVGVVFHDRLCIHLLVQSPVDVIWQYEPLLHPLVMPPFQLTLPLWWRCAPTWHSGSVFDPCTLPSW